MIEARQVDKVTRDYKKTETAKSPSAILKISGSGPAPEMGYEWLNKTAIAAASLTRLVSPLLSNNAIFMTFPWLELQAEITSLILFYSLKKQTCQSNTIQEMQLRIQWLGHSIVEQPEQDEMQFRPLA